MSGKKGTIPWNKGKKGLQKHSNETLEKMSKNNQGEKNPMYGVEPWNKGKKTGPRSEETKIKMSQTCKEKRGYDISEFRKFRGKVNYLTEQIYNENKGIINPDDLPRSVAGVNGGYQIDHIQSVKECFDKGMSPEYCSRIENLQMLPWEENRKKWK